MKYALIVCFLFLAVLPARAERIAIAVLDLDAKGEGLGKGVADVITETVRYEFGKQKDIDLVAREKMEHLAKEKAIQLTGCTDIACAVQIGKALNVKKMIVGSVGKLRQKYMVFLRAVDVEKENVECNEREEGEVREEEISSLVPFAVEKIAACLSGNALFPESTAVALDKIGRDYQAQSDAIGKKDSLKAATLQGKALEALSKAVRMDPKYADAWFHLGMVNYGLKKHDEAEVAFSEVIKLEPAKVRGFYWRAFARAYGKKEYDKAAEDLETAIKVKPDFVQSYIALARLYLYMGDIKNKDRSLYQKARATVEAGQKANPKNEEWDKILKDLKDRGVR